jgi:hypothetical protein
VTCRKRSVGKGANGSRKAWPGGEEAPSHNAKQVGPNRNARSAVPTKAFRQTPMSRYRRLKIEGGAFFFTLAHADRGGDFLVRFGE